MSMEQHRCPSCGGSRGIHEQTCGPIRGADGKLLGRASCPCGWSGSQSDLTLREITRHAVRELDRTSAVVEAPAIVEPVRAALLARGLAPGCHVGETTWDPEKLVEWYAGQVVATVDAGAWFAINSLVNVLEKFCPSKLVHEGQQR